MKKQIQYNKNWMNKQKGKGLCIFCKNDKLKYSNLCEIHYFKSISSSLLRNRDKWEELRDIFHAQEGKCFFTGKDLILGLTAGLDHLEPRSTRPDLTSDVNNVRWVDKRINQMKGDMPVKEFIELCKLVSIKSEIGML